MRAPRVDVRRARSASGYAMLAALLVAVLAMTLALVVVGAVHALHVIESVDAAGWRASRLAADAVAAATDRMRWAPAMEGAVSAEEPSLRGAWTAAWTMTPGLGGPWPARRLRTAAAAGRAERRGDLTLVLRAEEWARGVSSERDAAVGAPLTVTGSGIYVGGCLRGRENVRFAAGGAGVDSVGSPLDDVRGGGLLPAAVHAGAGIFVAGTEIHADPTARSSPHDADPHTGETLPGAWVAGPTAEFFAAARALADPPGPALADGVLDLGALSAASSAELLHGRCILLPEADETLVTGIAPATAGPLVIVAQGDAVVGPAGEPVVLDGGLVVNGLLQVRGPLDLRGFLHAVSLEVDAPVSVSVLAGWRGRPLSGATLPMVVEAGS